MSTPIVSPEYVWRWQCDPVFDPASGGIVSTPLQVFYRRDLDLGDGSSKQAIAPATTPSIIVDLVASASKTVTVGGKTYGYGELVQALIAVIAQERTSA